MTAPTRTESELIQTEVARDDGVDVVAIMTPNASHFEIARMRPSTRASTSSATSRSPPHSRMLRNSSRRCETQASFSA